MQVRWTRQAVDSLAIVLEFCESHSLKQRKVVQMLVFQKTELLEEFPEMGTREPTLAGMHPTIGYRFLVAGFYKIVYRVEEETVWICHVLDARADPRRLAGISPV